MKHILLAQLAATWFMVGVIWFVQIVHYPLFELVGPATFAHYASDNMILTAWVVVPVMLVELATAAWLVRRRPPALPVSWAWLGLALIVVAWLSTLLLQAPRHLLMAAQGFDAESFEFILLSNWMRTAAWSLRGLLVLAMGWRLFQVNDPTLGP